MTTASTVPRLTLVVLWLWIVIGVVVVLLLFVVLTYNKLVRLRNETKTGWANIDVQLRRRSDLVPNLVEAVKGYAAHESQTFEEITKARAAARRPRARPPPRRPTPRWRLR